MSQKLKIGEIVQLAYYVSDIEKAAHEAHKLFGLGPFFIYRNIQLRDVMYRGLPSELDHSSAYAQHGSLMIEFCQQHNNSPSAFRDMYPAGGEGMHHVAKFVNDVSAEMARFKALGHETASHYYTRDGDVEVAFVDTRSVLGHMVEIYQPVEALAKFYHSVEKAALSWDGENLFRYLN